MDDSTECKILDMQSPGQRNLKQGRLPFSPVDSSKQREARNEVKSGTIHDELNEKNKTNFCVNKPEPGESAVSMGELQVIDITSPEKSHSTSTDEKENINKGKKDLSSLVSSLKDPPITKVSNVKKGQDEQSEQKAIQALVEEVPILKVTDPPTSDIKSVKKDKQNINMRKKRKRKNAALGSSPSIDSLFKKLKNSEPKVSGCAKLPDDPDIIICNPTEATKTGQAAKPSSPPVTCSSLNTSSTLTSSSDMETSLCEANSNSVKKDEGVKTCPSDRDNDPGPTENAAGGDLDASLKRKRKLFRSITPKQLAKQREVKEKQEERKKVRLEKELLKKSKLEEKQKLKEEKEKKRKEEIELKEKEKEERRIRKEEERIKKEEERLRKEEEKQKKEEERLKREEEKRKLGEEKRVAQEEEKEKNKKLKAKFAQFFVPKKEAPSPLSTKCPSHAAGGFMKFQVKENMRIAPLSRTCLSEARRIHLDTLFLEEKNEQEFETYLTELKKADYVLGTSPRTYPPEDKSPDEDECEIIEEEEEFGLDENNVLVQSSNSSNKTRVKAKLLQFCENRRPPYFGTWFKKSSIITGRRPFGKETLILDYEYDSDDDWEEEEVGESLSDSEGENEDATEEADQYEVDNDFFVPHGYLSDDEGKEDEESKEEPEDDEQEVKNPDAQKEKLKKKQVEFELEMKEKKKELKPKIYGCIWVGDKTCHPAYDRLVKILSTHRAINLSGSPLPISTKVNADTNLDSTLPKDRTGEEPQSAKRLGKNFPEGAVPDLIRMIHGNRYSKLFLTREFFEYWNAKIKSKKMEDGKIITDTPTDDVIPKRKIKMKIRELGNYGRFTEGGISHKHRTWYVAKDIREKYGLADLSFNNCWTYIIPPKEWPHDDSKMELDQPEPENEETQKPKSAMNLITKFTKVLTDKEKEEKKKKNLASTPKATCPTSTEEEVSGAQLQTPTMQQAELPSYVPSSSTKKRQSSPPRNAVKKKRIAFITLSKNDECPSNLEESKLKPAPSPSLPKTEDSKPKTKTQTISSFFLKSAEKAQKDNKKGEEQECILLD